MSQINERKPMTANKIREGCKAGYGSPVEGGMENAQVYFLAEIAAQLAELREEIAEFRKQFLNRSR